MQLGTETGQQLCPRCKEPLTVPAVFRDGEWMHRKCWEQGAHQLADATKISEAVRRMQELFPPFLFITELEVL
jgi:hypothetical protein